MWATVNQHPPVQHEGWMINGLETAFCCVPVPYGCQPWWLAQCLFLTTYLPSSYLFSFLPTYVWDLFPSELATKVKPNINSVEVHPYLSNNGHLVDCALVGAGSLWLCMWRAPDPRCVNIGWHFVQKVPHFLCRVVCIRLPTSLKWITAFHLLRKILLVFYARWEDLERGLFWEFMLGPHSQDSSLLGP